MADLPLRQRPGQGERLPGDAGHPGIAVGLDDVMALQPGPIDDMRPPVRRRLPTRPRSAEIDFSCIFNGPGALTATVIHVQELDPVWQLAGDNRRVTIPLPGNHLM